MTVSKGLTERRSPGILEVEEKTGTMGKFTARTLAILLVVALLAGHVLPAASAAQGPGVDGEVDSLLARMSPAERVGQLFLVSFKLRLQKHQKYQKHQKITAVSHLPKILLGNPKRLRLIRNGWQNFLQQKKILLKNGRKLIS